MPLRNVALTAPYMHDGSLKTLGEVVEFTTRRGFKEGRRMMQPWAEPGDKQDLLAFLHALTSDQKPVPLPVMPREAGPPTPSRRRCGASSASR